MVLIPQRESNAWGAFKIIDVDPAIDIVEDVYYLPHVNEGKWGIFDRDDRIVESTVERWYSDLRLNRQDPTSSTKARAITRSVSAQYEYIYGGRYVGHFGHFLTETLARLWPFAEGVLENQKFVFQGDEDPESWLALPYVADIFGALGINRENVVWSREAFWIPRLVIPHASFRTQADAHPAFSRLCRTIGDRILQSAGSLRSWKHPVYLSKTRLPFGVARIKNETEVVEVMESEGVEILYPEQLGLAEKIHLFGTAPVISGWAMSAHHISLFAPPKSRLEMITGSEVNSNFYLVDRLNGNDAHYYTEKGIRIADDAGAGWMASVELLDPKQTAYDLLNRMRRGAKPVGLKLRELTKLSETSAWGGSGMLQGSPSIEEHNNVYALPFDMDGRWGVFDSEDQAIELAIDRAGPDGRPHRCNPSSLISGSWIAEQLPAGSTYVYGGLFHRHFGNYLLETLSRLWPLAEGLPADWKIVMHGDGSPEAWWRTNYVRGTLSALGLTPDRIVCVDRPVRIERLIIPGQSFRLNAFGYLAYARLAHHIGEALTGVHARIPNSRPAYLATGAPTSGANWIANEQILIDELERNGVEVLFPESMNLTSKIELFASRRVVVGWASASQHISIFTPDAARQELITGATVDSNCLLVDMLNGNNSSYYDCNLSQSSAANPQSLSGWDIRDPKWAARELLHLL